MTKKKQKKKEKKTIEQKWKTGEKRKGKIERKRNETYCYFYFN